MYKKGNALEEQKHREGWIYGDFMPEGLAHDGRVEIKIVELDSSFTSAPHYNKTATKIDIVWEGRGIWLVGDKEVELEKGDYLIIAPMTHTCIRKILSDKIIVQTIKIPSLPGDKEFV